MEKEFSRDRLRTMILAKAKGISGEQLEAVLDELDVSRQYSITGIQSLDTFMRNAYEEKDERFDVTIRVIYGAIVPGLYSREKVREPHVRNVPAAFIKTIHIDGIKDQYELFVYVPGSKRPAGSATS